MIGRGIGEVVAVRGGLVEAALPRARVGEGVRICARDAAVHARVSAVRGERAILAPFGEARGLSSGDHVAVDPSAVQLVLGTQLLGRAVDAAGNPLDGKPPARGRRVDPDTIGALDARTPCRGAFWTGIRAIDGPLALARGARVGVFGSAGAGKSMLLDAIVAGVRADAVVVTLVGERGREAERRLARLDARTTAIVATSDRSAAERVRAAEAGFAQAAALRARGLEVLLVVDSLARICAAQRELGLAGGEPVGRGGYPASAFVLLARLLERAGPTAAGNVTLLATVLSDGADERDPVSEAARAALDGHLALSERLASAGHFPAIDVVRSTSRTFADAASDEHRAAARLVRAALAALEESRDARALGLPLADPFLGRAVAAEPALERFLRQGSEPAMPDETLTELRRLADILT